MHPWTPALALALAVVLVSLYVVLVLRVVLRTKWAALAQGLITRCKALAWRPKGDSERAIQEKMQETRLSNAQSLLWPLLHLSFAVVGWTVTESLSGYPLTLTIAQEFVLLLAFGMFLLLHLFPMLLNVKTVGLFYHACLAFACVSVLPGISPPNKALDTTVHSSSALFALLGLTALHGLSFACWSSIYVGAACLSFSLSPMHQNTSSAYLSVAISKGAFWVFTWLLQRLAESRHERSLEFRHLEEKDLASNKLLKIFYDVVLEVDADLAITSAAPELARWLPNTAGSATPVIQGTKLPDLIVDTEEDRHLFVERMQRLGEREDPGVEVMHLNMGHDGCDSLSVELFSYQFAAITERRRHLIGIREFGDEVSRAGGQPQRNSDSQVLTMRLDAMPSQLPITEVSENLEQILGHVPLGSSFCHLVDFVPEFTLRFEQAINEAHSRECGRSNPFRVQLRPLGRSDARILADCCVALDEESSEGEASGGTSMPVILRFSNPEQTTFHARRQSSTTMGSTTSSGSCPRRARVGTPRQLPSQPLGGTPHPTALGAALGPVLSL